MCNHRWTENVQKIFFDRDNQCMTEIRIQTCIFCGKQKKELIRVKDPPRRHSLKFIKHDLSDM